MYSSNLFIILVLKKGGDRQHAPAARVSTQFPLLCPHLYFGVALMLFKPLDVITGPTLH